jgi:hypothetical protein
MQNVRQNKSGLRPDKNRNGSNAKEKRRLNSRGFSMDVNRSFTKSQ